MQELDDVRATFAARVQDVRKNVRGWSQPELAKRLALRGVNVDPTAVTRIERGTRSVRLDEAVAIADALGVALADLTQSPDEGGPQWAKSQIVGALRDAEAAWEAVRDDTASLIVARIAVEQAAEIARENGVPDSVVKPLLRRLAGYEVDAATAAGRAQIGRS